MTAAEITRAQMQQRTVVGMLMAQCVPRILFVGLFFFSKARASLRV